MTTKPLVIPVTEAANEAVQQALQAWANVNGLNIQSFDYTDGLLTVIFN